MLHDHATLGTFLSRSEDRWLIRKRLIKFSPFQHVASPCPMPGSTFCATITSPPGKAKKHNLYKMTSTREFLNNKHGGGALQFWRLLKTEPRHQIARRNESCVVFLGIERSQLAPAWPCDTAIIEVKIRQQRRDV